MIASPGAIVERLCSRSPAAIEQLRMDILVTLPPADALELEEQARLEGVSVDVLVNRLLLSLSLRSAEAAGLTDPRFDHGRTQSQPLKFQH